MFSLKRGDIQRLSEATGICHETVRRYVHGGNIRVNAAKLIDAAYAELKPVQAVKAAEKAIRRAGQSERARTRRGGAPAGTGAATVSETPAESGT